MRHDQILKLADFQTTPLDPCELVTTKMLRDLARGETEWQTGTITPEMQSILVMILPDMCGELIARRAVMAR